MKIGVQILAYNEEQLLGAVIKNWLGKVERIVVFHSSTPWHGHSLPSDRSEEVAKHFGVEFVRLPWSSETAQRNWALGYMAECDYVLIVDADELYTEEDQLRILSELGTVRPFQDNQNAYRVPNVTTYFKTPEYRLEPRDTHEPVVAVNPKKVTFREHRTISTDYSIVLDTVTMHHLSYLRNDLRLFHKMMQFEHYDQVKANWYADVWKKWTPEMENVRAYGLENSKAIVDPMPQELVDMVHACNPDTLLLQ